MGRKVTEQEIIDRCYELGLDFIRTYNNGHDTRVIYICPVHKDKGELDSAWCHLKCATYGCKYCAGKEKTKEDFLQQLGEIDYEIISEYLGFEKPITCRCNICGNIWTTTPKALWQKSGCPKCGRLKAAQKRRNTHEEFVERLYTISPKIKIIGKYKSLRQPIECQCVDCKHIWVSRPDNLLYENIQCPRCTSSKPEMLLGEILNGIFNNVHHHARFDDCKYKNVLEFDYVVYDDNSNILFACEYDGEGHFKPIDFAGKGIKFAQEQLELTRIRDTIKNDYCKKNHIPMIRIPYWEKDNMEIFLQHQIKINNIVIECVETAG